MNNKTLLVLKTSVVVLIFASIAAFIAKHLPELASVELHFRLWDLVVSVGLNIVFIVNLALIWTIITRKTGAAIPADRSVIVWSLSEAGKYVPSKLLLFASRVYLYRREGRGTREVTLSLYLEVICVILASVLMLILSALLVPSEILRPFKPILTPMALVLLGTAHPRVLERAGSPILKIFGKEPLRLKITCREILGITGLYFLNYGILGWAFWFLVRSFTSIGPAAVPFLLGAILLGGLAGILIFFLPAGLGVREGVLTLCLSVMMPPAVAGIVALAARVWSSGTELSLMALSLMAAKRRGIKF